MQLIRNNPYRTIGLLVGATAREQEKQIRRLKQFIEAEQEPKDDFSFPTLGQLNRTVDSVTEAASKLNLDSDKINAAIFWFYNGSHTDEPAFEALKVGDFVQAINIWTKLIINESSEAFPPPYYELSSRNASAYFNLGTLLLSGILESSHIKFVQSKGVPTYEKFLGEGIKLKLNFLESDFIKDFKSLATDETFKTTKKDLQLLFLNQVQLEVDKNGAVTSQKFIEILNKQNFLAKDDFLKGFVQKPIEQIEKKIEEAKTKRKANKANAFSIGKALFEQSSESLSQLKSILGTSNIKYTTIADKLANEILQCSIDYFNDSQDKESNNDYAEVAMQLAKQTQTIAAGNLTKDRIKDSINTLEEMKDREISRAIQTLQSIKDAYETNKAEINAKVMSMPLGYNQTVNWSKVNQMIEKSLDWDKVVDLILKVIPLKNVEKIKNTNKPSQINEYKTLVDFVLSKLSYSQINNVKYICYWKEVSTIWTATKNISTQKTKDACYIATMAYGNYDHPQVMVLREFRDEVLSKSQFGKWFIKTYYHYSPKMVDKMINKKVLNTLIRKGLNQFIKLIK
jgi:hypothetical protein